MSLYPNFLIIGAARSGTTTLYSYMKDHPDIFLPKNKRPEPHFFFKASEYAQGLEYYRNRFFSEVSRQTAIGEASTSYLFGPETPALVHKHFPDIRLIAILRNPRERAFSNYWHSVKSGLETTTFEEAISCENERTASLKGTELAELMPYSYLARGLYFEQLSRWRRYFDPSQMHIVLFEDLTQNTADELKRIYSFLHVDVNLLPERYERVENRSRSSDEKIDAQTDQFMQGFFEKDVIALQHLLDRDLTSWLA